MDRDIRLAPHAAAARANARIADTGQRVTATDAALRLIDELHRRHGPVMLFHAGGDGGVPVFYPAGGFAIDDTDVYLGNLHGAPFYVAQEQFEQCRHLQLIVDVAPLDGVTDPASGAARFLLRSRLLGDPCHP
ncbi:DUF779 domain-containing protein [Massilia sp. METH4]|uniref:DUF779 domain-containing protein n=1 Tax=Massilia sp. METH4 TaxID=3123041 RepID=UPI0030CE0C47